MRKAFPIAVAFFVLFAWTVTMFALPAFFKGPISVNEFGDMFGAVNALFSGLALVALIATLWLQHQELGRQAGTQREQAELLKLTARLHAINGLLSSYTQQIALAQGTLSGSEFNRVDSLRIELERLVRATER